MNWLLTLRRLLTLSLLATSLVFFTKPGTVWGEEGWAEVVKKGEKEGRVMIYASANLGHFPIIRAAFNKKYPDIKVVTVLGRSVYYTRPVHEHRANKYLVDLIIGSPSRLYRTLSRAKSPKMLEPVRPALMLPDVIDQSLWWRGKHTYIDPQGQDVFMFESSIYGAQLAYNTNRVDPTQFNSVWDILEPKWKGKILAPDIVGIGGLNSVNFIYHHPEMGPQYLTKLYTELDPTLYRNFSRAVDRLASGPFSLCLACRRVPLAMEQGLPVNEISPYQFKEKQGVGGGSGAIVRVTHAPHPNAAKVFLNWWLSREGQITFRLANEMNPRKSSLRDDIPEKLLPKVRRIKGKDYMFVNRWDRLDYKALVKFAKGIQKPR